MSKGLPNGWCTSIVEEMINVTDYVANGSFASLRENVRYMDNPGYAILIRLLDFKNGWNGEYKYINKHAFHFLSKSELVSVQKSAKF